MFSKLNFTYVLQKSAIFAREEKKGLTTLGKQLALTYLIDRRHEQADTCFSVRVYIWLGIQKTGMNKVSSSS